MGFARRVDRVPLSVAFEPKGDTALGPGVNEGRSLRTLQNLGCGDGKPDLQVFS
jgi:hypothetical protein